MNKDAKIYVAGHRGLVGSALVRRLRAKVDDPFEKKMIQTIRGVGYVLKAD